MEQPSCHSHFKDSVKKQQKSCCVILPSAILLHIPTMDYSMLQHSLSKEQYYAPETGVSQGVYH